tara:strand:+ start:7654 stop:11541 length:3888 start_codon:yes stop_codon:yes gene_type:complete
MNSLTFANPLSVASASNSSANPATNLNNISNINSNYNITNMNVLKVYNKTTKRYLNLYKKGTKTINQNVKKIIKNNINSVDLPYGFSIDKISKRIIPMFSGSQNKITPRFRKLIKENPNRFKLFLGNNFYNFNTGRIINKDLVVKKNGEFRKKYKNVVQANGKIIQKPKGNYQMGNVITRNNGLNKSYIFRNPNATISNIPDFINVIKNSVYSQIPYQYLTRGNVKILIKVGESFRYIPFEEIDNLEDYLNNWAEKEYGSDASEIRPENLDFRFFRPTFIGNEISGGANRKKCSSEWFKTDNAPSKNNLCLEAQLCRGLKLKIYPKILRKEMINKYKYGIEDNKKIDIKVLHLYEEYLECKINIYEDTPHYQENEKGETILEPNLIRKSKKFYNKSIDILLKDEHYCLITGKKIQKGKLTTKELSNMKKLGFKTDTKSNNKTLEFYKELYTKFIKEQKEKYSDYSEDKFNAYKKSDKFKNKWEQYKKDNKQKGKKLKEIAVFFDIETIFDINDDNFLKCYSGAWFCWDMEKDFKYNEEQHLKDCYYYGENALDKFVRFLLEAPEGIKYKPIGYNNSRFDNFALCEKALEYGVLKNSFFVEGSILYCVIEGCSPSWDCCRFLPAFSLDRACKAYKTEPKKAPDLINHYEVQCYFEKNGMKKLQELLQKNKDLIKYNKLDCISLCDLTLKMRNGLKEMTNGQDILKSYTISSFGWKLGEKCWKEKSESGEYDILPPDNYIDDCFIRESLTAGRTQSFYGKIDLKMPLCMGDIKSLYPSVMGNYGSKESPNLCPYPVGKYTHTDEYVEGKLGIYNVDIIHQKTKWENEEEIYKQFKIIEEKYGYNLYKKYAPCVIAERSKDKPLNWFNRGLIENRVLNSVDIEVIRNATGDYDCIKVKGGIFWEQSRTDIFIPYLDPPRIEKSKQDWNKENDPENYNVAKREGSKLLSNSFSGKLLENIHSEIQELFSTKKFIELEEEDIQDLDIIDFGGGLSVITGKKDCSEVYDSMKSKKPSYLGMFVYSYARKLMYNKLLRKYINLYMDTDSCCMPKSEWDRLNKDYEGKNFVDTGEYGCIEEEVCGKDSNGKMIYADRLIAISPKNYLVENSKCDNLSKRKFKGIRKTDLWLPLDYFGKVDYIINKNGKKVVNPKCKSVLKVRSLSQNDIRRFREIKVCNDCINNVFNKKSCCKCCKNYQSLMKKSYTTEMFEYMVNDKPIVVFCSMINKIKFRYGEKINWDYSDKLNGKLDESVMDIIFKGNNKQPISLKMDKDEDGEYLETFSEREIIDSFKLKQQFLAKIV